MVPNEYRQIFQALFLKTTSGELAWSEGADSGQFIVVIGSNVFSIKMTPHLGSLHRGFTMELFNSTGEQIDSFDIESDDDDYETAERIFAGARRSANKIFEAIRNIEGILGIKKNNDFQP